MNEEIKLRAWDKIDNRFLYRNIFDRNWYATPENDSKGCHCVREIHPNDRNSLIIELYIGLNDKNYKEMYDGDVCKFIILQSETQKPLNEQTVIISKENLCWGFKPTHPELVSEDDRKWRPFYREEEDEIWDNKYFEVIGNIHENPELLE